MPEKLFCSFCGRRLEYGKCPSQIAEQDYDSFDMCPDPEESGGHEPTAEEIERERRIKERLCEDCAVPLHHRRRGTRCKPCQKKADEFSKALMDQLSQGTALLDLVEGAK